MGEVAAQIAQGTVLCDNLNSTQNRPLCPAISRCDDKGEGWLLTLVVACVVASVITGVSNAISTAISGGSVEECLIAGAVGVAAGTAGFMTAALGGFTPGANIAGRAVSSLICDLGTPLATKGRITERDLRIAVVDTVIDCGASAVIYYYTDSINSFVKQTTINASFDAGVDIVESVGYLAIPEFDNKQHSSYGYDARGDGTWKRPFDKVACCY